MVSIERFSEILDQLAEELPTEFFDELNLGIIVNPEAKLHEQARDNDLFIQGEYCRSQLGGGVVIYYGSFLQLWGQASQEQLTGELRKVLRHELRHHMEYRAGERGLEIEDENQLREYLGE